MARIEAPISWYLVQSSAIMLSRLPNQQEVVCLCALRLVCTDKLEMWCVLSRVFIDEQLIIIRRMTLITCCVCVALSMVVTGFLPQRSGFIPREVPVEFVVSWCFSFPFRSSLHQSSILICRQGLAQALICCCTYRPVENEGYMGFMWVWVSGGDSI